MKGSEPPSSSTVFLRASPAAAATDMPGRLAPGQRHRGDARVVDERGDSLDGTKRLVKTPSGSPARRNRSSMARRGLRHVGRVLEQPDVAHHERRRGEADHLPEREVPRHDGQHRAEWLVVHVGLRPAGGDRLVGQQRLGVLGEPAQADGALRHLGLGGGERLAHLGREDARHVGHLPLEQLGRGQQMAGPLGVGRRPVLGEGGRWPVRGWPRPPRGVWAGNSFSVFPVAGLMVAKGMRGVLPGHGPGRAGQSEVLGDGASYELPGGRVGQVRGGEVGLGPLVRGEPGRGGGPQGLLGGRAGRRTIGGLRGRRRRRPAGPIARRAGRRRPPRRSRRRRPGRSRPRRGRR